MIILPALPAIGAALATLANAVLVSAGIGAAVSGATCAVTGAVSGFQEQGEINREVAVEMIQGVPKCAAEGALVGGMFGGAGVLFAPAITPVVQIADDMAAPVIKPVIQMADDATRPVFNGMRKAAHSVLMSADEVAYNALKNVRNVAPPVIKKLLPKANRSVGFVYVFDDAASGASKIGRSIDPKRRLGEVKSPAGTKPEIACTIATSNMKALENSLHAAYAAQNIPNSGAGREWFKLSSAQVKAICN